MTETITVTFGEGIRSVAENAQAYSSLANQLAHLPREHDADVVRVRFVWEKDPRVAIFESDVPYGVLFR